MKNSLLCKPTGADVESSSAKFQASPAAVFIASPSQLHDCAAPSTPLNSLARGQAHFLWLADAHARQMTQALGTFAETGFLDPMASSRSGACRKHTARLPPDLIWLEWFNGRRPELRALTRGRPLAVYRSNLLDHIGSQSSFAVRTTRPKWPGCFDSMAGVWSLHKTERFQVLPVR